MLPVMATFIVPGLAIMLLAYRRSPMFIRWRTACVIVLRLARSVMVYLLQTQQYIESVRSLQLPSSPVRLIFHLTHPVGATTD